MKKFYKRKIITTLFILCLVLSSVMVSYAKGNAQTTFKLGGNDCTIYLKEIPNAFGSDRVEVTAKVIGPSANHYFLTGVLTVGYKKYNDGSDQMKYTSAQFKDVKKGQVLLSDTYNAREASVEVTLKILAAKKTVTLSFTD